MSHCKCSIICNYKSNIIINNIEYNDACLVNQVTREIPVYDIIPPSPLMEIEEWKSVVRKITDTFEKDMLKIHHLLKLMRDDRLGTIPIRGNLSYKTLIKVAITTCIYEIIAKRDERIWNNLKFRRTMYNKLDELQLQSPLVFVSLFDNIKMEIKELFPQIESIRENETMISQLHKVYAKSNEKDKYIAIHCMINFYHKQNSQLVMNFEKEIK